MNSNLHTTEDVLITYFFCFVHLIIFKNSETIWILNIETLESPDRKNRVILCLFWRFVRTSNGFKTSVYNKPTFCWVNFVSALLFWTFSIVSDFSRFYSQVFPLKDILEKNPFPIKLIDSCLKKFFSKRLTEKPVKLAAKKKSSIIVLPFLAKLSLDLWTLLKNSFSKNLPFCKIRAIFKCSTRVFNFAQFKVKMLYCLRPNVV